MTDFNTNSGALFPNDKKTKSNQPSLRGQFNFNGKEYWASAWRKISSESGKPYVSIALQEKEVENAETVNAELHPVEERRSDKAPAFEGFIRVSETEELPLVAWVKVASTTGVNFFSIKVNEQEQGSGDKIDEGDVFFGMGAAQPTQQPQQPTDQGMDDGWDDDIPF